MEWRGREWRAGQGRVPDCLGGLSRVGISSRSTRLWNGQPPSVTYVDQVHQTYDYNPDMPAFYLFLLCRFCVKLMSCIVL